MNHLFQYLNFGFAVAASVQAFFSMVAAKQQVTGAQVLAAATPAILGLQGAFPAVKLPEQLITDVSQAVATAMDKYVFKAPTLTAPAVPVAVPTH